MTGTFVRLCMCIFLALPAYAGEGAIRETDSQIIIEYTGGEDDAKSAKARQEELQAKMKKEEEEQQTEIQKEEEERQAGIIKEEDDKELATRREEVRRAKSAGKNDK